LRISGSGETAWFGPASSVTLRALLAFGLFAGLTVAALKANSNRPTAQPPVRVAKRVELASAAAPTPTPAPAPAPKRKPAVPAAISGEDIGVFAAMLQAPSDDLAERDRAEAQDPNEVLRFGPVSIRRGLVEAIMRAARRVRIDPALLMAIADKESSFSTDVKASTSSATGLFQFIDSTWLRVVRQFGAQHGLEQEAAEIEGPDDKPYIADAQERERVLGMRQYPYLSALLAGEMLKRDGGKIAQIVGRDLSVGETYLTHFLGPAGASLFMQKFAEEPKVAAANVFRSPARANRPIFYAGKRGKPLSIAGVHDKFEDMMDARLRRYAPLGQPDNSTTAVARAPASSPFGSPSIAPVPGALAYTD
jgi:hypothetical protein